ncbi:3702_t:CDS:2 [Funneliformis caledonium]|uniref:3702_t:CDS:1 n=1 Tax=Funneliformis caledonium TaxID=1117310 RepID=A0A9N9F1H5_9GLOM|nr:3702_t:CDS:2 [Funneliformis caledonium]
MGDLLDRLIFKDTRPDRNAMVNNSGTINDNKLTENISNKTDEEDDESDFENSESEYLLSDWKIKQLFTDDDWCEITKEVCEQPLRIAKTLSRFRNERFIKYCCIKKKKSETNLKGKAKLGHQLDGILRTYNDNVKYKAIEVNSLFVQINSTERLKDRLNSIYTSMTYSIQPCLMVMKCIEVIDEKLPDLTEEKFIQEIINGGK